MYKDYAIDYNSSEKLRRTRSLLRKTRAGMDVLLYCVLFTTMALAYVSGLGDIKQLWLLFIPAFLCHMASIALTKLSHYPPVTVDEHAQIGLPKKTKHSRRKQYRNKLRSMMDTNEILEWAIYLGWISGLFSTLVVLVQLSRLLRIVIMG